MSGRNADPRLAGFSHADLPARLEELARRCEESAAAHLAGGQEGWAAWLEGQASGYRAQLAAMERAARRKAGR